MEYHFADRIMGIKPSPIRESVKFADAGNLISFAQGSPSAEAIPMQEMKIISDYLYGTNPVRLFQYGVTEGYAPLRQTLRERMKTKHNCGREFDELVIVSGAQQAVELIAKVTVNPGDTVLCEDPSFVGSINAFKSFGVNLRGIGMERDGIDLSELERALEEETNPKILYLIPNFQNPLGSTMSLAKRKAVYELAKKHGLLILEDDPYGELRFEGEPLPSIKSMDEEGIVVYCSSLSKIIAAGIRVGFVLAPKPVVEKMIIAKQAEDVHTNLFFQALCDHFIVDFPFDAHLNRIRGIYRGKCALMSAALREKCQDFIDFQEPKGGFFIWCDVTEDISVVELCGRLRKNGLAVFPGSMLSVSGTRGSQAIRLNFSTSSGEEIAAGTDILARTLNELRKGTERNT